MSWNEHPFALASLGSSWQRVASADYYFENNHRPESHSVILQQTISGTGVFEMDGIRHLVPEGALFIAIVPEASRYFFDPSVADHWAFRWLNFTGSLGIQMWDDLRRRFGTVVSFPEGTLAHREIGRLIRDFEDRRSQSLQAKTESAYAAFVACWSQLAGIGTGASEPVEQLRERIRAQFHDPVNIKELSADLGVSREHLARQFKSKYLTEPGAYLRELRMKHVEILLEQSALPIDEIARRCGFASAKTLIRTFARVNGCSPGAWRMRARSARARSRSREIRMGDETIRRVRS